MLEKLNTPDVIIALNTSSTFIAKRAVETIGPGSKVISWIHFSVDHLSGRKFLKYADDHLAIINGIFEDLKAITLKIPSKLVSNPIELTKNYMKEIRK